MINKELKNINLVEIEREINEKLKERFSKGDKTTIDEFHNDTIKIISDVMDNYKIIEKNISISPRRLHYDDIKEAIYINDMGAKVS